jgi:hypothetical protein
VGARRPLAVAAALAVLAVGAGAGWTLERTSTATRTVADDTGTIKVTVPESWTAQVDPEQWTPVEGEQTQPSLAAGTRGGWNSADEPSPGVFVGILAADKLPSRVPQHKECVDAPGGLIRDQRDGDASMTVFFSGCPGADVMVERVIQVNSSQLLWVQVRSDERGTANQVLDSVTTSGI